MSKAVFKYGLGIFLLLLMSACGRQEAVTDESAAGAYVYQIVPSGELTATKAFPASALYVLTVFAAEGNPSVVEASQANRYAHGVFSDPLRMYVRMDPGKKYRIQLKAIIDGGEKVYHEGVFYEGMGTLSNKPRYFAQNQSDAAFYLNTASGAARETGSEAVSANPALDTFFGETLFVPVFAGHKQIDMLVSRCSFGLRLEANGMSQEDNPLELSYTVGETVFHASIPAANPVVWEVVRTLSDLPAAAAAARLDQPYSISSTVNLHYSAVINGIPYDSDILKDLVINLHRNICTTIRATIERHLVETLDDIPVGLVVEEGPLEDYDSASFGGEVDTNATE